MVFGNFLDNSHKVTVFIQNQVTTPGSVLKGTVILNIKDKMKTEGLIFTVKGQMYCKYEEPSTEHTQGLRLWVDKVFLLRSFSHAQVDALIKDPARGGVNVIPGGEYRFPFSLTIPANLPGSLDGRDQGIPVAPGRQPPRKYDSCHNTKVEYTIDVTLKSSGFLNSSLRRTLALPIYEPFTEPNEPKSGRNTVKLSTCCRDRGEVSCDYSLEKQAFQPGEPMKIKLFIDNTLGGKNITAKVCIIQTISLRAGFNSRYFAEPRSKILKIPVAKGEIWENELCIVLRNNLQCSTRFTHPFSCEYSVDVILSRGLGVSQPITIYCNTDAKDVLMPEPPVQPGQTVFNELLMTSVGDFHQGLLQGSLYRR